MGLIARLTSWPMRVVRFVDRLLRRVVDATPHDDLFD